MNHSEYLSEHFHIKIGNYLITKNSLKANIRYLAKVYDIDYTLLTYSIDKDFDEPVTFKGCYNEELDLIYYNLPNKQYNKLRYNSQTIQGATIDRVVDNACIMAKMNEGKFDINDVDMMRYLFLVVAMHCMNEKAKSDITVNDLLVACCRNLENKLANNTIKECILSQCVLNCSRKTITLGNISSAEKNRLSHMKHEGEERDYVLFLYSEGYSYRAIIKEFENRYEKKISLYGVQSIIKSS